MGRSAGRAKIGSYERGSHPPLRVCVVCAGNICRSPMAEVVLRTKLDAAGLGDAVVVDSAGTGGWHVGSPASRGAQRALARRGYATDHVARRFDPAWYADRDLVLALDTANARDLRRIAPDAAARDKVRMLGAFAYDAAAAAGADYPGDRAEWSVPDPYELPDAAFEHALDLVERAADGFVTAVRQGTLASWPAPDRRG